MSDTLEGMNCSEVSGFIRPTPHAYESARAYMALVPDAPVAEFTPDADGGIDIEWEVGDRRMTLWCRLDPQRPHGSLRGRCGRVPA